MEILDIRARIAIETTMGTTRIGIKRKFRRTGTELTFPRVKGS